MDAFTRRWMDPDDWPRCKVRIEDLDIANGVREIGGVERFDKLFVRARTGESPAGWIGVQCSRGHDSVVPGDITAGVSPYAGWLAWCSSSSPSAALADCDPDLYGWRSMKARMNSFPREADSEVQVAASIPANGSASISELFVPDEPVRIEDALSECASGYVVLAAKDDSIDPDWRKSVLRHFADGSVRCVITSAILRNVSKRGEELYHVLADFDRMRSWWPTCVTDWM